MSVPDVIDHLAGIAEGSRLDGLRRRRPQARDNAQNSFLALFRPAGTEGLSRTERFAVAAFAAGLHGAPRVQAFYVDELAASGDPGLRTAIGDAIAAGETQGPYGRYPSGPLSVEDRAGPDYRVASAQRAALGSRLAAALDHAHLLVFHPRDAAPAHLQALLDAGLSTTEIVTLSQLVAFLSFQIRVVAGLETLAASGANR